MECHKLKSALGYVSKNDCEQDSNLCPHQPETYSAIEVKAILKRMTAKQDLSEGAQKYQVHNSNNITATKLIVGLPQS